ncbi:MAG TPA: hypothetical protein VD970_00430 [Acetobacteraceae bacterium]|nr:hypothetical protein [Acetobacteraceae bacterium]
MKVITLEEREAQIRRKLASGVLVPPLDDLVNSGLRRTPEKRALLKRLQKEADAQGRPLPFKANY